MVDQELCPIALVSAQEYGDQIQPMSDEALKPLILILCSSILSAYNLHQLSLTAYIFPPPKDCVHELSTRPVDVRIRQLNGIQFDAGSVLDVAIAHASEELSSFLGPRIE